MMNESKWNLIFRFKWSFTAHIIIIIAHCVLKIQLEYIKINKRNQSRAYVWLSLWKITFLSFYYCNMWQMGLVSLCFFFIPTRSFIMCVNLGRRIPLLLIMIPWNPILLLHVAIFLFRIIFFLHIEDTKDKLYVSAIHKQQKNMANKQKK